MLIWVLSWTLQDSILLRSCGPDGPDQQHPERGGGAWSFGAAFPAVQSPLTKQAAHSRVYSAS